MAESKVGRSSTGNGFYTLRTAEKQRLAYLWQRELFRDLPDIPDRLRMEFWEIWNPPVWEPLLDGVEQTPQAFAARLREHLASGAIQLARVIRSPGQVALRCAIYDGTQLVIDDPKPDIKGEYVPALERAIPKSLFWSELHVKEYL